MILVYVLRYSNQSKSTKLNKLFLPSLIWWAKRTLIAIIQYQKFTQNIKFESILIINIKKKVKFKLKKKSFYSSPKQLAMAKTPAHKNTGYIFVTSPDIRKKKKFTHDSKIHDVLHAYDNTFSSFWIEFVL